jgi:hypothetical protein
MGVRGLVLGACGRVWWCLLGALAVTPATQCGAAPGTCFIDSMARVSDTPTRAIVCMVLEGPASCKTKHDASCLGTAVARHRAPGLGADSSGANTSAASLCAYMGRVRRLGRATSDADRVLGCT